MLTALANSAPVIAPAQVIDLANRIGADAKLLCDSLTTVPPEDAVKGVGVTSGAETPATAKVTGQPSVEVPLPAAKGKG